MRITHDTEQTLLGSVTSRAAWFRESFRLSGSVCHGQKILIPRVNLHVVLVLLNRKGKTALNFALPGLGVGAA